MIWWRSKKKKYQFYKLDPDEILIDSHNLPSFDTQQFEGRIEKAIPKKSLNYLIFFVIFVFMFFIGRLGQIQILRHEFYAQKSEQNSLDHIPVFADRGIIYDRKGVELAWNSLGNEEIQTIRQYIKQEGFSSLLGYVSYPAKDSNGNFWRDRVLGRAGVEKEFDEVLAGKNGKRLIETSVTGEIFSGNIVEDPVPGENIYLSIDSRIQSILFDGIKALAERSGYVGGGGAIMDIETGELIAITSYPEYDSNILSLGKDKETIATYMTGPGKVFLNRMTGGLYTPGSIVKPFLALGALNEGVIDQYKNIYSSGELRIPNPYNPNEYTIFKDNDAHGYVDLRKALAVSSNIYFYQITGGFGDQKGIGIENIEKYLRMFGIGEKTGIDIFTELEGVIPNVEWKAKTFKGDIWRLGDTYNTSIGQYGLQVTPIQMLRGVAGISSGGKLVNPTIHKNFSSRVRQEVLDIDPKHYKPVQEGMRQVVTDGTGGSLRNSSVSVSAKTGTAQIKANTRVNSWVIGFFPSENPKYAFTVIMEDGPKTSSGAAHAMRPVIEWYAENLDLLK